MTGRVATAPFRRAEFEARLAEVRSTGPGVVTQLTLVSLAFAGSLIVPRLVPGLSFMLVACVGAAVMLTVLTLWGWPYAPLRQSIRARVSGVRRGFVGLPAPVRPGPRGICAA